MITSTMKENIDEVSLSFSFPLFLHLNSVVVLMNHNRYYLSADVFLLLSKCMSFQYTLFSLK